MKGIYQLPFKLQQAARVNASRLMPVAGGAERFLDICAATGTSLCGRWPVAAFLAVAQVRIC